MGFGGGRGLMWLGVVEGITCCKCVVCVVEADGVDRIHLLYTVLLHAVALEGVLLLLHLLLGVQVLHGNAALDRTQHKAYKIAHH